MDELIANSIQIQDIEPYSPVHSEHGDDDDDDGDENEDDYMVLPDEDSSMHLKLSLSQSKDAHQLTFTSDDNQGQSVDEYEVSQLLQSLVLNIEQMIIDENREKQKYKKSK